MEVTCLNFYLNRYDMSLKIPNYFLLAADQFSICDQAAQALAYMHCLNPPQIHQDAKPMNILVSHNHITV